MSYIIDRPQWFCLGDVIRLFTSILSNFRRYFLISHLPILYSIQNTDNSITVILISFEFEFFSRSAPVNQCYSTPVYNINYVFYVPSISINPFLCVYTGHKLPRRRQLYCSTLDDLRSEQFVVILYKTFGASSEGASALPGASKEHIRYGTYREWFKAKIRVEFIPIRTSAIGYL